VEKTRTSINAGALCLVTGGVLTVAGTIHLSAFLNRIQDYKTVTPGQLMRELVLPHIVLLAGVGLVTAAFVLFTRHAIVRRRQMHREP
jgi:hypothetical protein